MRWVSHEKDEECIPFTVQRQTALVQQMKSVSVIYRLQTTVEMAHWRQPVAEKQTVLKTQVKWKR